MYISNFWVVISVIWIIYLLWRNSSLNKSLGKLAGELDSLLKRDARVRQEAIKRASDIIIWTDKQIIKKVDKKTYEKLLDEQSACLLNLARYSHDSANSYEQKSLDSLFWNFDAIGVDFYDEEGNIRIPEAKREVKEQLDESIKQK